MSRSFVVCALVVLVLDIVTKAIVYRTLPLGGPPIEVLGEWLRWTYIHNTGAAFGLFQGNRLVFVAVSVVSSVVIVYLVATGRYRDRWTPVALGLILGGAIGNLIDRLWLGAVIDFIDVGIGPHRWPFFNIADSGITIGVTILIARLLFVKEPAESEPNVSNDPDSLPERGGTRDGPRDASRDREDDSREWMRS